MISSSVIVRTQAGLSRSQGTAAAAEKSCFFQPVMSLRCCRLPKKSSLLRILLINLSCVQFFLFLNEYLRLDCYCFIKRDCEEHT